MADGNQDQKDILATGPEMYDVPSSGFNLGERLKYFWENLLVRSGLSHHMLYAILAALILFWPLYLLLNLGLTSVFTSSTLRESPEPATFVPQAVSVAETFVIKRSADTAVGVIHLRNPNRGLGLGDLELSWTGLDNNGTAVAAGSIRTYVRPEDDKYIIVPIFEAEPRTLEASLASHIGSLARGSIDIDFEVINVRAENVEGKFVINGEVLNGSPYELTAVDLVALVRDATGRVLAAISSQLNDFEPGSVRGFSVVWPTELPLSSLVDVGVEADTFSPANFRLPQAE